MQSEDNIEILTISEDESNLPEYSSTNASGADVRANIKDNIILKPGESILVPTGLKFAIPHGFEVQVRPRSGLALKHQITVLNTPGTIDSDYRGEVGIILINHGKNDFTITPGMRVAQLVVSKTIQAEFIQAGQLAETLRGSGGFGHTGLN